MHSNLNAIFESILVTELALIVALLAILYLYRIYIFIKEDSREKEKAKLLLFWQEAKHNPDLLTDKAVKFSRKKIAGVLMLMKQEPSLEEIAPLFYEKIVNAVLLPSGRRLIKKYNYIQKYYATICLYYKFELEDEPSLLKLLAYSMNLVSINAAITIFRHGSDALLEKAIKHLSGWDELQQNVIAHLIVDYRPKSSKILFDYLEKEKAQAVRAFCYRLLLLLPFEPKTITHLDEDLGSEFLDLRVAALNYLIKAKDIARLRTFMQADEWIFRAKAAHALGKLLDEESLDSLTQALSDTEWWVRLRSAEALLRFGEKGVAILKQQSSKQNALAAEVAKEVLFRHVYRQKRI
jgi:hypothetical protein